MRRSMPFMLVWLFTMAVAACGFGGGGSGPVHTYLLGQESRSQSPAPVVTGRKATAVLLVNRPQAQAGFETPRMAYLLRPLEVSYFAASQWADTPARMVTPLLVQALERTGTWRAVVQMPSPVRGDYRLDSEELILAQEFFQQPSRLRLTLRAQLVELKGQGILGTRSFEVLEETVSDDAYGGVIAANRAVTKLLDQVAAWVSGCTHETAPRGC